MLEGERNTWRINPAAYACLMPVTCISLTISQRANEEHLLDCQSPLPPTPTHTTQSHHRQQPSSSRHWKGCHAHMVSQAADIC